MVGVLKFSNLARKTSFVCVIVYLRVIIIILVLTLVVSILVKTIFVRIGIFCKLMFQKLIICNIVFLSGL